MIILYPLILSFFMENEDIFIFKVDKKGDVVDNLDSISVPR